MAVRMLSFAPLVSSSSKVSQLCRSNCTNAEVKQGTRAVSRCQRKSNPVQCRPYPLRRSPITSLSSQKFNCSFWLRSIKLKSPQRVKRFAEKSLRVRRKKDRGPANRKAAAQSAYVSPPAYARYLSSVFGDEDDAEEVLGSIPVAPRGPKPVITLSVVSNLLGKQKVRLALALLGLFGATTCTLVVPIFSGRFFETLIGKRPGPIWKLLSKLGVVYAMEPAFTILFVTNMVHIWEKVMANLRSQIFRRILVQKVEFFDHHKVGELTSILSSDLGAVKDIVNENVSRDRGFRALSEITGTFVILFFLSAQLAPVLGVFVFSISAIVAIYRRTTIPVFKAHGVAQARINDCASETFAAIRTVRSFGGERSQMETFDEQVLASQKSGNKLGWLKARNESWTRAAIYISRMVLYVLGGTKVKAGELAVGTMVSFVEYTVIMTSAVQGVVTTLADLQGMLAAVDRINSVVASAEVDQWLARGLEREARGDLGSPREQATELRTESFLTQKLSSSNGLSPKLETQTLFAHKGQRSVSELAWTGDMVLEGVRFMNFLCVLMISLQITGMEFEHLTMRIVRKALGEVLGKKGLHKELVEDNLLQDGCLLFPGNFISSSLQLLRGTVTALVGPSGVGKSTIVQLLARFYEPTGGRITLAGKDVRKFDKAEWARAISIVNQEPVLFAISIAENIAYGLPYEDVSIEEIIEAAKAANAHDFISSLPQGYDTRVGERGSLLSGGQRQRIAIARTLLKNAPILILDEATSALDSVSERLVQDALKRLMKGRTTLVIAHRLSTVQAANQILVCKSGRVVEQGTHGELLAQGGSYASLVDTQRLTFE